MDGWRWRISGLFGRLAWGYEAYIKFVVVAGEAIEEEMSVHLVLEDDN